MRTFVPAAVPPGAKTLAAGAYTSVEVFERERARIFSRSWICVERAENVAAPGEYVLAEVDGESIILVRDARGGLHALYNVCRHRGTRLCNEPEGKLKGAIVCPYHAWTYRLDGSLLTARDAGEEVAASLERYALRRAAVALHDGFIFVNLAAEPEPFHDAFPRLPGRFDAWGIATLRSARRIAYELRCNWKLVFQNYSECYHCAIIHPQLERLSPSTSGRNDLDEGPVLGGYMVLRDAVATFTQSGATARPALRGLDGDERARAYFYTVFPSLLLSLHPDYVMAHYVTPLAADRTRVVCEWLFDPETMARAGFDPADAVEFWDTTNRQDWHVNELTQLGVASRAYEPGPYVQREGLLYAFDRHYRDVMRESTPQS